MISDWIPTRSGTIGRKSGATSLQVQTLQKCMTLFHVTAIYRSLAQRAQMSAAPALNHVRARLFPLTRAFIWRRLLHSQTEKYTVSVNGDKLFVL